MFNVSKVVILKHTQYNDTKLKKLCSVSFLLNLLNVNCIIIYWYFFFFAGTSVEQVIATDADSGMNAKIKYRIQKGGFEDFNIDEETGVVAIANRLDFDRRNTYNMEVIAVDGGRGLQISYFIYVLFFFFRHVRS